MGRVLCIILILALSGTARAQDNEANKWDPFDWKNRDHAIHMLAGFGLTYTIHNVLRKTTKLTKAESLLISVLAVSVAGVVKEVYVDEFSSRGNHTANFIGIGTGAVFAISFGL